MLEDLGDESHCPNLDSENCENLTGSNLSSLKVLEMPPAEPEFSQAELATGTHDNLPTQKLASIIDNAEADVTATANNEI